MRFRKKTRHSKRKRRNMKSKIVILAFLLLALPALAQAQCISSGGQISCVIPGATVTGTGTSQVVTLAGGMVLNANVTINGTGPGVAGGGLIIGSNSATKGSFWSNGVTPSTTNYALSASSANTVVNSPSGGSVILSINDGPSGSQVDFNAGVFYPDTDNNIAFGKITNRWSSVNAVGVLVNSVANSNAIVTESYIPPTSCSGGGCALSTGSLNSVGTLTTTTTGPATITVNFSITATNGSACQVQNETTANILKPTSTTTALVITGTTVSGDKLSYQCQFF